MKSRWFPGWALLLIVMTIDAHAAPRLLDKMALVDMLASSPPCCVVDARTSSERGQHPIKDALVYRSSMRINPTATVVVVGDTDAKALGAAKALDKGHPGKVIVAVRGGFPVWESILIDKEHATSVQGSSSFVIPKNTCEQDTPLQILPRGRP